MNISMRKRLAALAVTTAAIAGVTMAAGAGSADAAAPSAGTRVTVTTAADTGISVAYVYYDNILRGTFQWSQNPSSDGSRPGDAMRVSDSYADGWGVEGDLSTGRIATTAGHSSPYTSPWKTGNLPEKNWYDFDVYLEKGGSYIYIGGGSVES